MPTTTIICCGCLRPIEGDDVDLCSKCELRTLVKETSKSLERLQKMQTKLDAWIEENRS